MRSLVEELPFLSTFLSNFYPPSLLLAARDWKSSLCACGRTRHPPPERNSLLQVALLSRQNHLCSESVTTFLVPSSLMTTKYRGKIHIIATIIVWAVII